MGSEDGFDFDGNGDGQFDFSNAKDIFSSFFGGEDNPLGEQMNGIFEGIDSDGMFTSLFETTGPIDPNEIFAKAFGGDSGGSGGSSGGFGGDGDNDLSDMMQQLMGGMANDMRARNGKHDEMAGDINMVMENMFRGEQQQKHPGQHRSWDSTNGDDDGEGMQGFSF
jgi:hypothetical protein